MSRIGWKHTIEVHDLSKLTKAAKLVPKVIPCTIKVPTKQDYKNIPKKFVVGRPLLKWEKLLKLPTNIKRLHDWYMRASSIGIDTISICIPQKAFLSPTRSA
jgi:hypothetical protein